MHRYRKLLKALLLRWPIRHRAHCALCDRDVGGFLPYHDGWRGAPEVVRALAVVGSDLDHFECPRCGAHDRERHLLLYLQASGLWERICEARILHAAPERRLSRLIAARAPAQYIRSDLYPVESDMQCINLEAIPLADVSLDLVIANHVLEHVSDLERALAEIGRVLAPGGHAVLQVPFSRMLSGTIDDPSVRTEAGRLALYGQEDHVRLFGMDVFERFERGLGCAMVGGEHAKLLPDVDPRIAGVNASEPFMLFRKPA